MYPATQELNYYFFYKWNDISNPTLLNLLGEIQKGLNQNPPFKDQLTIEVENILAERQNKLQLTNIIPNLNI